MKILVLFHSHTGHTERTLRTFLRPFEAETQFEITYEKILPKEPLPFPWPFWTFFGIFPETVLGIPMALETPRIAQGATYDLIILGYQPWHLSPSPPTLSFLKSPWGRVLADTPVITVISCRRMWRAGHAVLTAELRKLGARLIGNLVVCQQGPGNATFVTTPMLMLTGKKKFATKLLDRYLPEATIAPADLDRAARFGHLVATNSGRLAELPPTALLEGESPGSSKGLRYAEKVGRGVFETLAKPAFRLSRPGTWARRLFALFFIATLGVMICIGLPMVLGLRFLLPRSDASASAPRASSP